MTTPGTITMLAFGLPGHYEWIVLLILGLLIFGRRLPEVGRSLGKGIVEFKRGIKGIDDEVETESSKPGRPAEVPPPEPPASLGAAPPEPRVARETPREETENAGQPVEAEPTATDADRSSG